MSKRCGGFRKNNNTRYCVTYRAVPCRAVQCSAYLFFWSRCVVEIAATKQSTNINLLLGRYVNPANTRSTPPLSVVETNLTERPQGSTDVSWPAKIDARQEVYPRKHARPMNNNVVYKRVARTSEAPTLPTLITYLAFAYNASTPPHCITLI